MAKTLLPLTIDNPPAGAIKITSRELLAFGIPQTALDAGEMRGDLKTIGMWHIPVSYRALAMSCVWDNSAGYTVTKSATIYGVRTLADCKQSGHELEGRISIAGKRVRGFTSSQLFEIENGKLVNIATIHACVNDSAHK
jgi:hypothetical protein